MVTDKLNELSLILIEKKELEEKEKALKEEILNLMETSNTKQFNAKYIKVTYVGTQTKESLDTTLLKKMDHSLYDELMTQYPKVTITKPSLRVTLHG